MKARLRTLKWSIFRHRQQKARFCCEHWANEETVFTADDVKLNGQFKLQNTAFCQGQRRPIAHDEMIQQTNVHQCQCVFQFLREQ